MPEHGNAPREGRDPRKEKPGAEAESLNADYRTNSDTPTGMSYAELMEFLIDKGLANDNNRPEAKRRAIQLLHIAQAKVEISGSLDTLITSADEFAAREIKEEEWLIEGLLPRGGTAVLVAYAKTGKSTVGTQIAYCVQHGIEFMGRATSQANVIYHDEEGSEIGWQNRLIKPKHALGIEASDLRFLHRQGVLWTDEGRMDELEAYVTANNIGLLISGPLRQIAEMDDEFREKGFTKLMRGFNGLAQRTGCSTLILQHPRKRGKDAQRIPSVSDFFEAAAGNNAMEGAVDAGIGLLRPDDEQPNAGYLYWRTREPSNFGATLGKEPYSYNPEEWLIKSDQNVTFDGETVKNRRFLDHLYAKGWQTANQIATELHGSPQQARRRLNNLLGEENPKVRTRKTKSDKNIINQWDLDEDFRARMQFERGDQAVDTDIIELPDDVLEEAPE